MYAELVANWLSEFCSIIGMIGVVVSVLYTVGSAIKTRLNK